MKERLLHKIEDDIIVPTSLTIDHATMYVGSCGMWAIPSKLTNLSFNLL